MASKPLPKIQQPIYTCVLPSNNREIRFRPFTVKEEKLLLMAAETKETADIFNTYKQIINNCIIDEIDVDQMPVIDIELFFLRLRARSVSNIAEFMITDAEDGKTYPASVDLDEVNVVFDPEHTNVIQLTDQLGLKMRYPTFENVVEFDRLKRIDPKKALTYLFKSCIDCIFTEDEVFAAEEYTAEEIEEFFDGLRRPQLEALEKFAATMPRIKHVVEYKREDGELRTIEIEGIDNFF